MRAGRGEASERDARSRLWTLVATFVAVVALVAVGMFVVWPFNPAAGLAVCLVSMGVGLRLMVLQIGV